MSILNVADHMSDDEKFALAEEHFDTVLAILPDYTPFKTEDKIRELIKDEALEGKLQKCHTQITKLLFRYDYVRVPAGRNTMLELTDEGRKAKEAGGHLAYLTSRVPLSVHTDRVARYITSPANKNKTYNSKEISKALSIDFDTVEMIADKLYRRKLIELSIGDGCYNLHVMPALREFVREHSFEEESKRQQPIQGNFSVITVGGNFSGNLVSQSSTVGEANDFSQRSTTTPNKKNSTNSNISWFNKPIFEKLLWPIIVGLILLAVAIILNQRYGLSA